MFVRYVPNMVARVCGCDVCVCNNAFAYAFRMQQPSAEDATDVRIDGVPVYLLLLFLLENPRNRKRNS